MSTDELLEHAAFVRGLARRLVFDPHTADDAAQEALATALERPPRHAANLRAWLARVVRNHIRTLRRAEARRARHEGGAARDPRTPSTADLAQRVEMQRKVVDAVAALDAPYRDVVVLRYFDGLKPGAIARRLSLPVDTVRTRLKRALALLRGRLDKVYGGDRRAWMLALVPLALPSTASALALGLALPGGILMSWKKIGIAAVLLVAFGSVVGFRAFGRDTPLESQRPHAERIAPGAETGDPTEEETESERATDEVYVHRARVRDEDNVPVPGAVVEVFDYVGGIERPLRLETGGDGRFEVRLENPADCRLIITHPEYYSATPSVMFQGEGEAEYILYRGAPVRVAIRDADGNPIDNAHVSVELRIQTTTPSTRQVMWHSHPLSEGTTGPDGRFTAGGVPPEGKIQVFVTHPKFASTSVTRTVVGDGAVSLDVQLDAGDAIAGRVFDPEGKPVAGARVFTKSLPPREAWTDEEGRYHLEHLGGSHEIWAAAGAKGAGFFGRTLGWRTAVPVRAGSTGIDIHLVPPAWVKGRLVDDRGEPLRDIDVVIWTHELGHFPDARSDAEGRFLLGPCALMEPGVVDVHFDTDRYASFGTRHVAFAPLDSFRLAPGATVDLGELTGVRRGTVRGRVLAADGTPAVGGIVTARGDNDSHGSAPVLPGGHFVLRHVGPGRVKVAAQAWPPLRRSAEVEVTVEPGGVVEGVELELEPYRVVTGRVLGAGGRPREHVAVACVAADGTPPFTWHQYAYDYTDKEGRFTLNGLSEGKLRVGLVDDLGQWIEFLEDPPPQEAEAGDELEFVVKGAGATVRGRVVDDRDGTPLRDYMVVLMKFELFIPRHAQSDWGSDRFELPVTEPGRYVIEIRADGFASKRSEPFRIEAGDERDLGVLRLGPNGSLEVVARDHAGAGVPHARVYAISAKLEGDRDAPYTDRDGRCVLGSVTPGTYNVFVVSPRHPLGIARGVKIEEGRRRRLDVHLPAAAPVTILVQDDAGRPLAGARLVYTFPALQPLDSRLAERVEPTTFGVNVSDEAGRIVKPYLPPGELSLAIHADGYRTERRQVTRAGGEPTELVVQCKPDR